MTRIAHNLHAISSAAVNVAAANFPASNVISTAIDRQWRSTGTGTNIDLDLDLGADRSIVAVCVQHVNVASITVRADAAPTNPATTLRGTITTARDTSGRSKGALFASYTARRIRLQIAAGTPLAEDDGLPLGYFYIGSVYVFARSTNIPRDPLFGASITHAYAQAIGEAGAQELVATLSPPFAQIALPFSARAADDIEVARRLARLGPVWLDLEQPGRPALQWPVRSTEDRSVRTIARFNGETVPLNFREVV